MYVVLDVTCKQTMSKEICNVVDDESNKNFGLKWIKQYRGMSTKCDVFRYR